MQTVDGRPGARCSVHERHREVVAGDDREHGGVEAVEGQDPRRQIPPGEYAYRKVSSVASEREYEYVLEPQPEGGYLIYVPDLPGLATEGRTREEAVEMLKDALGGYLDAVRERGWALPEVERGKVAAP